MIKYFRLGDWHFAIVRLLYENEFRWVIANFTPAPDDAHDVCAAVIGLWDCYMERNVLTCDHR